MDSESGTTDGLEDGQKSILWTEAVVKRFGGLTALNRVSIKLAKGRLTLLIGPNGSGKTTLVNVISGFLQPDEGRIMYKGMDITRLPPHERARLGLMRTFQVPKPFQNLTVLENVVVAVDDHPGENPYLSPFSKSRWKRFEKAQVEKAFKILEMVRLTHKWDSRASELSGGQLKLLEIARALMRGAETVVMDEPAAGINPVLVDELFERIVALSREHGVTFLIVEHRIGLVGKYMDYAYAMNMGEVICEGPPEKVLNDPLVLESYLGG